MIQREKYLEHGSAFSNLINNGDKEKNVTAEKIRSVVTLTIDKNSGIDNLEELFNFPSLQTLRINNMFLESLAGIENAPALENIYLTNFTSNNYDGLGKLGKNLKELYIINSSDAELNKIFGTYDEEKKVGIKNGLSNYDLPNLNTLEISGYLWDKFTSYGGILNTGWRAKADNQNKNITKISQLNNLTNTTKKAIINLLINNNKLISLNGIQDFSGLQILRAESNELDNVNELENINLTYLYLSENLFGNNKDALKGLENIENSHSNLNFLRLDKCGVIKISYLKSYETSNNIKDILAQGNLEIIDVSTLLKLKSKCNLYLDDKYSISLLDPDVTSDLSFSGQTLTLDNLEAIGKCTKIYRLILKNVVIVNNDNEVISDVTKSSSENLILANTKVQEMLKKLVNLRVIDLEGCKFITNLEFINSLDVAKNTAGYYIRLKNTMITSLSPLDRLGTKLTVLSCYGAPCSPNDLNDTILKGLLNNERSNSEFDEWVCSLSIDSVQASSLRIPEGLTSVDLLAGASNIDFSSCDTITSVQFRDSFVTYKVNPKNLKKINAFQNKVTFSADTQGGTVYCRASDSDTIQNALNSFSSVQLGLWNRDINFEDFENCSKIISLEATDSSFGVRTVKGMNKLSNLTTISFSNIGSSWDFSDMSSLTNLVDVRLNNPVGDDILTKLPISNLTYLELRNSKFTDISPLLKAQNLQTLDLRYGIIRDRFSYVDELGKKHINESTLGVLVDLNKNYSLKNLYLDGCTKISDFSPLLESGVSWTKKSGF